MNVNNIENINPVRLKQARISRGYSLADLSDRIGVTKQYISQCELGITNASSIIYKLSDVLNYPISFFCKSTKGIETSSATYFRSRKTTPKKLKEAANEKVELFSEIKDFFEEYVNYPELNLPNDIELKDEYTLEDIECREKLNQIEKEADAFAGAFLLPAETFSREVFSSSLDNLVRLKERWKVSISCMINRCLNLGLFTDNQVAYLKKQMTYKNYWRREPLDDTIQCEIPYLYKQILELLLENEILSKYDIVNGIAMNPEEIEEYCYLKDGTLSENRSGKIISMKDFRK